MNEVKPTFTEDFKREAAVLHHNYERIMRELGVGKSVLFRYFYQMITSQESSFIKEVSQLAAAPDGGDNKKLYEMKNVELVEHINNLESRLLYLERKHKAIIDNVKCVIFQTDKEGRWTYLSPAWTKIMGFGIEECIGTSFLNYVYPDDREFHHKQFLAIIEREKAYCRYEIRYSTPKGDFRWIEIYNRLMMDEDGNIVGTLGTLHDITVQRKTEKMLHLAYELRRRSDFLNDIINGSIIVDEVNKDYMKTIGLDISRPICCCLIASKGFIGREKEQNSIIEVLGHEKNCIVWNCRNDIGVIYQIVKDDADALESSSFAYSLMEKIRKCNPKLKAVIGISSQQIGSDSLRKTYWQAWSATIVAQCQGNDKEGIYHYKDLGILQLLVKNIGNEGADEFVQEQIGKLILYDQEKGTNLLITLEEILQNSNLKKTAEKMFLHPKTVVFRKQRIEKILGISIDLFETRLALAVALKLYAVSQVLRKN